MFIAIAAVRVGCSAFSRRIFSNVSEQAQIIGDVLPYAVGWRGVTPPAFCPLFFLLSFLLDQLSTKKPLYILQGLNCWFILSGFTYSFLFVSPSAYPR